MQDREVNTAFAIAENVNRIYSGTITGITFTNEYFTDVGKGEKMLGMLRWDKQRAHNLGLKVGVRIHTCGEIRNPQTRMYEILANIVRESDFIYCNIYPGKY